MNKVVVVAHRGGGKGVFENRIETIKSTLQKKHIDAVEVDLRLTKDNVLVIQHDRGVYINGGRVWIDHTDYAVIKHLGVPTLEEVVDLCNSASKSLNIDIKDERCIPALKTFLSTHTLKQPYYLDCFDIKVLLELQETFTGGEYFLSLNPKDSYDFSRRFVTRILLLLTAIFFSQFIVYFLRKKIKKVKIDGISIYYKFASKDFIRDLKAFGFKVFIWGTDREFEIQKFYNEPVDGIKTRNLTFFETLS